MYVNKNFKIDNKLIYQLENEGYFVIKKYFSKKVIQSINNKVNKLILNKNSFYPPRDINYYKSNKRALKNPNGTLKVQLDDHSINKGYKYFSKLTNGVSYKDPLLYIRNLKKIFLKDKFIDLMNHLFEKKCNFGNIKLATYFRNKLPKNCINYFHTDDLASNGKKNCKTLKISIALNIENNKYSEYMHLPINRKNLNFKKQYFEKSYLAQSIKKKIISPKIELGDIIVFDPSNFYHAAKKPTTKIRNILYLEFVLDEKKSSRLKIFKDDFRSLSIKQKLFCRNFFKI